MKNVYHIYEYIRFLINKEAKYYSPNDVMEALHNAQMVTFLEKLGNPSKYQVAHPIAPVSYQITKRVAEDLRPFLREREYVKTGAYKIENGQITLPEDFVYPTSLRAGRRGADIKVVDDDKVASRLASKVVPVNAQNPIAEIQSNGYRVYPEDVESVFLKYIKYPARPVYAVDSEEEYDDASSVGLEWNEMAQQEIIARAVTALGLNLRDANTISYGQTKTQQGG